MIVSHDGHRIWESQPAIVVITSFEPIVARAVVAEIEFADALEIFYAVFDRDDQTQRGAVASLEGFAVHLVAEQGLRMHGAGRVDAYIVFVVGSTEADIAEGRFFLKAIMLNKVAEFYAAPPGDLAPTFDTLEF